jgi:Nuclease-related domain/AAA domain/UvrD-like helicase C-terminal domain
MIPSSIWSEASPAERRVFEELRRTLPDSYTVIHHVQWLQRRPGGGAGDGETDFVLVHPEHGVLILEVKGGGIRYEAATGRWFTQPRDGDEKPLMRSPFDQVVDAKHSLQRWLRELPGWRREWGPFGHAVCFPDAVTRGEPLPHMPREVVIDAHAVLDERHLRGRVEEAYALWADGSRLGPAGAQRIVTALAHDIEIRQPLGILVEEADREILRLSPRQYGVLLTLAGARRVAVSGPAGAGKTLLAAEKARRLASEGKRTLLTCFNRPLADYLRGSLAQVENLEVWSYHQLCRRVALEARLSLPPEPWSEREWEQVELLLEPAAERLGPRYDALVVDEAQDFKDWWWLPLLTLQHDPDHGILYVFHDANQAIYGRPGGMPDVQLETHLHENFRNTKAIFETVMSFYEGREVTCHGPDGLPVFRQTVSVRELRKELGRMLHRLIMEGDLSPSDVVVLTPRGMEHSTVRGRVGAYHLTPTPQGRGEIKLSTLHRFKGLDAPAVVVCEVSERDGPEFRSQMYVACSRARSLLAVLVTA